MSAIGNSLRDNQENRNAIQQIFDTYGVECLIPESAIVPWFQTGTYQAILQISNPEQLKTFLHWMTSPRMFWSQSTIRYVVKAFQIMGCPDRLPTFVEAVKLSRNHYSNPDFKNIPVHDLLQKAKRTLPLPENILKVLTLAAPSMKEGADIEAVSKCDAELDGLL